MVDRPWLKETADGVLLHLAIQPGAKTTAVVGLHGERLKIRVQAPPVDGAANEALVAFLAKTLACPKSRVTLTKGMTGRQKTIKIQGVISEEVARRLGV